MRAMILAAGRGERMKPLTNTRPKPLLEINDKPLIQYHIENLVSNGIREIVINHGIMGDQIEAFLGNGNSLGADIVYSPEGNTPLETGGGIFQALDLLGGDTFIAVNADIWTDYPFRQLPAKLAGSAYIALVANPPHNSQGDFSLTGNRVSNSGKDMLTFSGIGMYRRKLFSGCNPGVFSLTPLLRQAADRNEVTGEYFHGLWIDIGTPERLEMVRKMAI